MTKEDGIKHIDDATWILDKYNCLNLLIFNPEGGIIHCYLQLRPEECDRGHISLGIDGLKSLDKMDSFPRYFFNTDEAKQHTKTFLKWRLWKHRTFPHELK
jgi:hypothetical protein